MTDQELKNRLGYLRGKLGSIENVARELDVTLRTCQLWYSEKGKPSFIMIERIEEAIKKLLAQEKENEEKQSAITSV